MCMDHDFMILKTVILILSQETNYYKDENLK